MLQNKQNLLLLLIVLLISYNLFTTNGLKTDIKSYKNQIEALQTKADSAQVVDQQIDTKIDSVKDNVVNITKEIHHIDNSISVIKQQTNEKVNSVDILTANELEQFFTNRYDKGQN